MFTLFTLFYTVAVRANFVWLVREPHAWRLGKRNKLGELRFFSKKTALFLDADDEKKICKVLAKSKGDDRERPVGGVEVLFVAEPGGVVSIRAGGHDRSEDPIEPKGFEKSLKPVLPHGDLDNWTEFGTWSATKGLRLNKQAHPVFRKDSEGLIQAAQEVAGGSGVFHPERTPDDVSIFAGQHLTEL